MLGSFTQYNLVIVHLLKHSFLEFSGSLFEFVCLESSVISSNTAFIITFSAQLE